MLLLAFDTATPAITVAVHDGSDVIGAAEGRGATAHGELLAERIRRAVESAGVSMRDVTDIAVGVGPGPFTGLRVGVVTALTLGHTLNARTHGVCSLDTLAAEVVGPEEFLVATDARRKEVYWARYRGGRRVAGPAVDRPAAVAEQGLPVVGRGAALYADILTPAGGPLDPSAAVLARIVAAGTVDTLPLEPLYLRRPDATPQPRLP